MVIVEMIVQVINVAVINVGHTGRMKASPLLCLNCLYSYPALLFAVGVVCKYTAGVFLVPELKLQKAKC